MNDKTIKDIQLALLFSGIIVYLCGLIMEDIILLTGSIVPIFMGYISSEFINLKNI